MADDGVKFDREAWEKGPVPPDLPIMGVSDLLRLIKEGKIVPRKQVVKQRRAGDES